MEKERKDFMISGASVLAIEKYNKQIFFYAVPHYDAGGMCSVSYDEFMEKFKELAFICAVSWDKELINKYREFYEYIQEVVR